MKKLDWYLIRKFLGTFIYSLFLIILIVIVFDISENVSDFIDGKAPLKAIIFDHYVNFIPYFVNMFSALFVFIAAIFFTSRMAANSEIIAILSSGISFRRLMVPYLLCAVLIGLANVYLANFLIPKVNQPRLAFEQKYLKDPKYNTDRNIHIQYDSTTFYYVESFSAYDFTGYRFTLEDISPQTGLSKKISAESVRFDSAQNIWKLYNYHIRTLDSIGEKIEHGYERTFDFPVRPNDFARNTYDISTMDYGELKTFIKQQQFRGSDRIKNYEYDSMVRFSHPFAALVLTLIALAISSRKTRGGTGFHLAIGLLIAFSFIVFLQFSRVFTTFGNTPVWFAAWFPIILFGLIALILLRTTPK